MRLLELKEVLARLTISKASLYNGMKKGHYPKPVKISLRRVGWRESDIEELVRSGMGGGVG